MDRRIAKTRKAIFSAFDALIAKKDYAKISVQDIIDEADIGRSTFYEHFETKDELLRAKCTDLFDHIFVPSGTEATQAFSRNSTFEEKIGILSGESGELFLRYFRGYLADMVQKTHPSMPGVPQEYLINHIAGSFIETVRWWTNRNFSDAPHLVAKYYMTVMRASVLFV